MGQGKGQQEALIQRQPEAARQGKEDGEFHQHNPDHQPDNQQRLAQDQGKVNRRAHGNKKQPQQQALEWLNIAFQLVAVFATRQHNTGQKRAQRRAQAHLRHQQRCANHQQQGRRREDFPHSCRRNRPKDGAQDKTPSQDHRRHRAQHRQRLRPSGQPGDQRCRRAVSIIAMGGGQQRRCRQ